MGRKHNTFVEADERTPQDRKLTRPGALTIVLLNPRIPQNTGAVARLCAATGSRLDIVNPFFKIDDAKLKRAGLDYWPLLDVRIFTDFDEWLDTNQIKWQNNAALAPWLVEVGGNQVYTEAAFCADGIVIFGDEQDGIAPSILERWPERHLRIPQVNVRSINLAMSVGVVCFEALRQLNWLDLETEFSGA